MSFRVGGLITGVLGILIQPWRLLSDPHIYIFTWLGFYGGILGTIAGADRRLLGGRATRLALGASTPATAGTGTRAAGTGARWWPPWPERCCRSAGRTPPPGPGAVPGPGLIPALKPLYDYSWVVGLGVGFALYLVLSLPAFGKTGDTPAI